MPKYNVYFMQTVRIFKDIEARDEKHAVDIVRREHCDGLFKTSILPWHVEAIKEIEPADFEPPDDNSI